jgi:hypothetical protein
MGLLAQSATFFRKDYRKAWRGTVLFAGVLFVGVLARSKNPDTDPSTVAVLIWILLAAVAALIETILIFRLGRWALWLIRLWGHSRGNNQTLRDALHASFNDYVYDEFAKSIYESWRQDVQKMKDDIKFR